MSSLTFSVASQWLTCSKGWHGLALASDAARLTNPLAIWHAPDRRLAFERPDPAEQPLPKLQRPRGDRASSSRASPVSIVDCPSEHLPWLYIHRKEDIRLETPSRHELRPTVSQPVGSSSSSDDPIPQLPFRPRTPTFVDGDDVQALNARIGNSFSSGRSHIVQLGPAETSAPATINAPVSPTLSADEGRLSDQDSVAVVSLSSANMALAIETG